MLSAVDGDSETLELLRAWLAALMHSRADLQKFLHLIGSGGTGKGTFMRLATALVGRHNAVSTTLKEMENNRFETARYYGARLVQITDSDKYGGSLDTLKALSRYLGRVYETCPQGTVTMPDHYTSLGRNQKPVAGQHRQTSQHRQRTTANQQRRSPA